MAFFNACSDLGYGYGMLWVRSQCYKGHIGGEFLLWWVGAWHVVALGLESVLSFLVLILVGVHCNRLGG